MGEHSIPYGNAELRFTIPEDRQVDVITPFESTSTADPQNLIQQALEKPAGEIRLEDFSGVNCAAIAVNDKTRPVPHNYLLPPILERLELLGLPPTKIRLLIAAGIHPPMSPDEFSSILPQAILDRYPVSCHDARDDRALICLGHTSRDTPVWVNREFAGADLRIVVGNIAPHQFQGFSGGVKSAAIGLAGEATINRNHALMIHPDASLGEYEMNPARQDVEEIGNMIGIHFALNAVLNDKKEIVQAFAGAPLMVMQKGIPIARQMCQVRAARKYNLLIVSPGGHPKDINLYQAQKAISHACLIAYPGATVILAAACPEGSGSRSYEDWMRGLNSFDEVFEKFSLEGFRVGPHKAYQIARDASRVKLRLLSDMSPDFARKLLLDPISNLQAAIDEALQEIPPGGAIGLIPHASATIPYTG